MRSSARPAGNARKPVKPAHKVRLSIARGDDGFLLSPKPGAAVTKYARRKKLRSTRTAKALAFLFAFVVFCLFHPFTRANCPAFKWLLSINL